MNLLKGGIDGMVNLCYNERCTQICEMFIVWFYRKRLEKMAELTLQTKPIKESAKTGDSRDRIIEASFQEFGRHGYEGASTNQICQAAGISKGLLYHYFKSKENLFFSVCDRCIADLEHDLDRDCFEGKKSDLDALLYFYQKQADFFRTHPAHYHILTQILNSSCESVESYINDKQKKYREQVGLALRLFLSRSPIRPSVDKELALEIMLEMISNLQSRYLDSIHRQQISPVLAQQLLEKNLRASLNIILNGILDPQNMERHDNR